MLVLWQLRLSDGTARIIALNVLGLNKVADN
jgi:hypothetical protein